MRESHGRARSCTCARISLCIYISYVVASLHSEHACRRCGFFASTMSRDHAWANSIHTTKTNMGTSIMSCAPRASTCANGPGSYGAARHAAQHVYAQLPEASA